MVCFKLAPTADVLGWCHRCVPAAAGPGPGSDLPEPTAVGKGNLGPISATVQASERGTT